jgi:hypothetical protein
LSVTVTLADGTTDQYTDHTPGDTDHGEHSYWIAAAGDLTVYACHPHTGHDELSETMEAIYSPTGWLKVAGRHRDDEPPTRAAY